MGSIDDVMVYVHRFSDGIPDFVQFADAPNLARGMSFQILTVYFCLPSLMSMFLNHMLLNHPQLHLGKPYLEYKNITDPEMQ